MMHPGHFKRRGRTPSINARPYCMENTDPPGHLSSTLSQRVAEFLQRELIEGRFNGSQRLTEDEIAARLGVSRSPVREAFRMLQHQGLLAIAARRGVFVRPLNGKDAADLYALQGAVLGLAARLSMARARPKELERLESVVQAMATALEVDDPNTFLQSFVDFARVLTELSGNQWIKRTLSLWEKTILRYGYFALSRIPGYMQEALGRYQCVVALMKAGRGEEAQLALSSSTEAGGMRVAEFLDRSEGLAKGADAPERAGHGRDAPGRAAGVRET